MPTEITIPSPGESITEVTVGHWHKSSGDWVEKDEMLVEIESDKATLELPAPESGRLDVKAGEGTDMKVGDVIGTIDASAEKPAGDGARSRKAASAAEAEAADEAEPETGEDDERDAPAEKAPRREPAGAPAGGDGGGRATPVARKVAAEKGLDLSAITGTGPSGRITKADVLAVAGKTESGDNGAARAAGPGAGGERPVRRERMSRLRRRIAERLVSAQQTAAMLTTFNEADMSAVMALRKKYREAFEETHGVGLGFMGFFVKACCSALSRSPRINAFIDGDSIEYHDFVDVSIAVGTDKGLVVPVIRDAHAMSFAEIEKSIRHLAAKARDGKLTLDEMSGGTFTISNGGVYGSLLSTPILNPPQSAILGMHRIMNRAVEDPANPGQIALRPMMYLALSYDHRIVDGEQAVRFLVHVKECIEDPERVMLGV